MMINIPHHVTGFWLPKYTEDPVTTGSYGAGLVLGSARAIKIPGRFAYYNNIDVTGLVTDALLRWGVHVSSELPLGYGYAGSAVLAIAAALINHEPKEAMVKAHIIEVRNGTGLGDVLSIATGGCLVYRERPGAPGVGKAIPIKCPRVYAITVDLKPQSTRVMLTQLKDMLTELGAKAISKFSSRPSFEAFIEVANWFSREVGFITSDVEDAAKSMRGLVGFFVKKGVAVFVVEAEWVSDDLELAARLGQARAFELIERRIEILKG